MKTARTRVALLAAAIITCCGAAQAGPLGLSGNTLWLDGADAFTITAPADITQWADKSGAGNHADLAAGGGQHPSVAAGALNGKDVVNFDGNDYLHLVGNINPATMFAVVRAPVTGSLQRIISGVPGHVDDLDIHQSGTFRVRFNSGEGDIIGTQDANYHIISAVEGADGVVSFDGAVTSLGARSFGGANSWSVGRPVQFDGQYLNGEIAEILVYNRELTHDGSGDAVTDEHNAVGFYLQDKWGIQGSFTGQAIPEPSTLMLATLGLLGILGCHRRRRRRAA